MCTFGPILCARGNARIGTGLSRYIARTDTGCSRGPGLSTHRHDTGHSRVIARKGTGLVRGIARSDTGRARKPRQREDCVAPTITGLSTVQSIQPYGSTGLVRRQRPRRHRRLTCLYCQDFVRGGPSIKRGTSRPCAQALSPLSPSLRPLPPPPRPIRATVLLIS